MPLGEDNETILPLQGWPRIEQRGCPFSVPRANDNMFLALEPPGSFSICPSGMSEKILCLGRDYGNDVKGRGVRIVGCQHKR